MIQTKMQKLLELQITSKQLLQKKLLKRTQQLLRMLESTIDITTKED